MCLLQEKGLDEAFWPILELDKPPQENWSNHWSLRLLTMAAVGATLWVILSYAPETGKPPAQCARHIWSPGAGSCSSSSASCVLRLVSWSHQRVITHF